MSKESMVEASSVASESLLNSKIIAYETEIQSLTADKLLVEQDLSEAKEALQKIQKELQLSLETSKAMQDENSILKSTLTTQKTDLQALPSLRAERESLEDTLRKIEKDKDNFMQELRDCKNQSAKDLGRLKNAQQEKLDMMMQEKAKLEHQLQSQIIDLKAQITNMSNEHKDVVTSQATRLRAYEHQINILETRCNRLQMSLEFSAKPKQQDQNLERQLKDMEKEREMHLKTMEDLEKRMSLARINQHYDFRAKSLF